MRASAEAEASGNRPARAGPMRDFRAWNASPTRTHFVTLLAVILLHVGAASLLLFLHSHQRLSGVAPPLQVGVISDSPPHVDMPHIRLPSLERPQIRLVMPEFPSSVAAADSITVSSSAPAAVTISAPPEKELPSPVAAVTPPRFDAAYLKNPPPAYPPASRRIREQGTVLMRVRVSSEGNANEVLLERSSGSPRLDQAAMEAVRRWRFVAAHRGAESVEAWVLVPLEFELQR